MKNFQPREGGDDDARGARGRNDERDFQDERRSNGTHASSADADARLYLSPYFASCLASAR